MAVKVKGLDESDARVRQSVATELIEWEMGKARTNNKVFESFRYFSMGKTWSPMSATCSSE